MCGLKNIHDYYGMVEQTGCIYMECECGHLHASNFSDVIICRPIDFSEADVGETGIIQVVSTIPESYPGHSLLTEDEGELIGVDDCPCGRKGKYFKINGRLNDASREILNDKRSRVYSDVVTFGFWIRRASTERLKERFEVRDGTYRMGKGMLFHIAPSNVPVHFAYSLAMGLLNGNSNIVRCRVKIFRRLG